LEEKEAEVANLTRMIGLNNQAQEVAGQA